MADITAANSPNVIQEGSPASRRRAFLPQVIVRLDASSPQPGNQARTVPHDCPRRFQGRALEAPSGRSHELVAQPFPDLTLHIFARRIT